MGGNVERTFYLIDTPRPTPPLCPVPQRMTAYPVTSTSGPYKRFLGNSIPYGKHQVKAHIWAGTVPRISTVEAPGATHFVKTGAFSHTGTVANTEVLELHLNNSATTFALSSLLLSLVEAFSVCSGSYPLRVLSPVKFRKNCHCLRTINS